MVVGDKLWIVYKAKINPRKAICKHPVSLFYFCLSWRSENFKCKLWSKLLLARLPVNFIMDLIHTVFI